ncbi:alpha,alpha-trehalose-phosphate synthase [Klebsiella pneumoniae]|uniref:Alpha,alpha-trehalose-phosphate synthase n=1 Tax=Klebsiella pneumoniae TaxID=573 RepID=A0A4P0YA61_KLEPN|nr:alpha,alpha-trehalose-phosphate synthase [Klebsiella pneumoniae]
MLWPAFHYRLDLVSFQREAWEGYLRVNAMLADKLLPLIEPDDTLWIHDYHLLPFASELRKRGVNNRIGFFLHIPFPTPEIFNALPPHAELLEQLCDYDLLGFQTESDRTAFLDSIAMQTRLSDLGDKRYQAWGKAFSTEVYPIGIDPDEITRNAKGPLPPKLAQLKNELKNVKNIFSVERLGLFERVAGAIPRLRDAAREVPSAPRQKSVIPRSRRPPAAMCRPIRISATSWKPQPDASTDSLVSLAGHRSTI